MGIETCDIPDNIFNGLDLVLPEELKQDVLSETHMQLSGCLVESLDISSGSELFSSIVEQVLLHAGATGKLKNVQMNEKFIHKLISVSLGGLNVNYPKEYNSLKLHPEKAYIVINGVSINFSDKLNYYVPKESYHPEEKPQARIEWSDEPKGGFKKGETVSLSDFINEKGISDSLLKSISIITGRDVSKKDGEYISMLIRYILEAETWGGYNKPHDDGFPGSGGYFEYQKNDGMKSKEVYDFGTKTFTDGGEWRDNDVVVKKLKGKNKVWVREVWKDSSYDIALRAIPEEIRNRDGDLQREHDNIGNSDNQNMSKLSAEQQIVVVLSDLFGDKRGPAYFERMFRGDVKAISEMYSYIHHADLTNPKTKKLKARLDREILGIGDGISLKSSKRPKTKPNGLGNTLIASND